MKLYLSSQNLGDYADELLKLVGDKKRVAYIGNAMDYGSPDARQDTINQHKSQYESLGFVFNEFDLTNYFDDPIADNVLDDYGLVWCSGGNTFLLNYAVHHSGFAAVLSRKVTSGELVYGGSSAGAILATPSLHGSENGDEPGHVTEIYGDEVVWPALNLVPFYIVPHYKSDWFGAEADSMVKYFENNGLPYHALHDGQVIICDEDETKVLR
jgi:dipeptidase E